MDGKSGGTDDDVSAIRALVTDQFRCLAWKPGTNADWSAFATGFLSGATLFPAARPVKSQTVDQFVDRMEWLRAEGALVSFEETPLGCDVRVYGNVAVALAACEMLENGTTITRDVSAFLLVRESAAWRIAAQAWDMETESQRIPADLAARGSV